MPRNRPRQALIGICLALAAVLVAAASGGSAEARPARASSAPFFFSTGNPDGLVAMGSRQTDAAGGQEIEAADDFVLSTQTTLTGGTFTGLLAFGATVANIVKVGVEIYRVFPLDSVDPPSGKVPTRVNSPSDVAFDSRSSDAGNLTFVAPVVQPSFFAANSVLNGIFAFPNQTTLGEGPVSGVEAQFDLSFTTPLVLPADHYFFVPQVQLSTGEFYWLSAPKPIVAPGTPFTPDLQTWMRNADLAPDWLRVGTDIIGSGTYNGTFSLSGETPTAVTVSSFAAARTRGGVRLRWRTASESGIAGFDVLRQRAGATSRVNRSLIRARSSASGGTYTYLDRAAPRRGALRYRLEVVGLDGSRRPFGPAAVRG